MNTNDLPPNAKLAALIEAGEAANPDLLHGVHHLLYNGHACAIGFAALAAGASRERLETRDVTEQNAKYWREAYRVLRPLLPTIQFNAVWMENDKGASLEEICTSLREGKLAKATA